MFQENILTIVIFILSSFLLLTKNQLFEVKNKTLEADFLQLFLGFYEM